MFTVSIVRDSKATVVLLFSGQLSKHSEESKIPLNISPNLGARRHFLTQGKERFVSEVCFENNTVFVFQKLEPFMTGCRSAAKLAMGVMQQFTSSTLGENIQECKDLLEQHHQKIKDVFEDSRLSALQVEGEQILIRLQEDEASLPKVPDYIETVNCVTKLYHQMNEVFCRLEMLTENRTRRLEQCLALKEFEKDMEEVWKVYMYIRILRHQPSSQTQSCFCLFS